MASPSKPRGQSATPTDEAPARDHNRPPSLLVLLQEQLTETYSNEIALVDPIAAAANALCDPKTHKPIPIDSDEAAAAWGKIYLEADKNFKSLDTARKNEKRPFEKLVDEHFKPTTDRLERIKATAREVSNGWTRKKAADEQARQDAERKRLRDEAEAARLAAEEAAAFEEPEAAEELQIAATVAEQQAAAPAPKPTAAASFEIGDGAKSQAKMIWKFEIEDIEAIDLNRLRVFLTPEIIGTAIGKYMRQQKEHSKLAGVRFYQEAETAFRR